MTRVVMTDGRVFADVEIDGGGTAFVGPDAGRREVHGTLPDGSFFCEFEDDIANLDDVVGDDR
jgi:hypothetical protein